MVANLLGRFFEKSPIAYAYQKIILDDRGVPIDYEFLDINGAMETLLSVKTTEIVGKRLREVCQGADQVKMEQWIERCGEVALNNKTITVDERECIFGERLSAKVFTLDKFYFATIIVDVQTVVPLEHVIDGFVHSNLDMLCVVNMSGQFIKVNKAFENKLGFSSRELEGKSILSFLHPEDRSETIEMLKTLKEQRHVNGVVNRYKHKNGSYKDIEWRVEASGELIFSSARDVSESKMLERELKRQNEELVQLAENLKATNEKLQTTSVTDELTGLYNRHFLDQKITAEIERADRYKEPISLYIFDLDHFKRVNDTYGHPVGDDVLKQTARIGSENIRSTDVLVRFGGEEFIVLLPRTTREGAIEAAEKMRVAIEKCTHVKAGKVTASFGVAERNRAESFKNWYKRADESLYQAKNNGRNCVFSYTQDTLPVATVNIQWRNEWESGNNEIDEQHRELLRLANGLIELSLAAVAPEKVIAQLDRFLNHVAYHFEHEMKALVAISYPEAVHHAEIHKTLIGKALKFRKDYQNGELKPSAFFSFIVDDVMMGHMLREDVRFFPFIPKD